MKKYGLLFICITLLAIVLIGANGYYPSLSSAILSFNAGEVSPLLLLRSDFNKYNNSCQTLENMFVLSQGPVTKRPGTKYIATVKDSNDVTRLIPFEYSKTDTYILELGNSYIRFYRNGGQIQKGAGTNDLSALDNITAHWKLDEEIGTVAEDSDDAHDGVITTDASGITETGMVDSCLDLDSTYAVEIDDDDEFSFTDDSNDSAFSIVCWAYVTEGDNQVLMSKWRNLFGTREWRFRVSENLKLQLHLADTSSNLSDDRVAQWKLNEDAANKTVLDDTTNNHDGLTQTSNTEDLTATGKTNMTPCLDFGGSDAVVITSDDDALSFGNGTSDSAFSVSAWVYVTPYTSKQIILSKCDWTSGAEAREWRFVVDESENLYYIIYDESGNGYWYQRSDSVLTTGWHFVCGTYDGTGGALAYSGMTLYVDGEEVASTPYGGSYTAMENTSTKVVIGGQYGTGGTLSTFFQDKIDNIILFDKELTESEVSALYNSGDGTEVLYGYEVYAISDDAVDIGWRFLGATYSAPTSDAADGIIFYVDGSAVSSTAYNNSNYTAMQNKTQKVRIGAMNNYGASALIDIWEDKIDEVSMYSDVLTPSEITALYDEGTYEIETVYDANEIWDIQYRQVENVMYLVDGNGIPQKLSRQNHTDWTIEDYEMETGPFLNENENSDINIIPSANTGNITLIANSSIFDSGHIGALWEIGHQKTSTSLTGSFSGNGTSASSLACSGGYDFNVEGSWIGTVTLERSDDSGVTWKAVYTRYNNNVALNEDYSDSEDDDGVTYRVTMTNHSSGSANYNFNIHDYVGYGIVEITGYEDANEVSATVLSDLYDTNATTKWSEGAWSDYRGWPQAIAFHEQRLMFGGSTSYPQTIWTTKTASGEDDDYENMSAGVDDDDALIYFLPGQNPIQWMLSQTYLLIGTLSGIGRWGSADDDTPITSTQPTNYRVQAQHGSAFIPAVLVGDSILYVERGGRRVREFAYSLEKDRFVAPDMTILSEHIVDEGIKEIAYQSRPDSVLWCVLNDGNMACLTYERSHDVVGWARIVTDGDFESVAVIPSDDEDEVWVTVERTIDSNTLRYVEQFQPRDWGSDQNDCWFVDSGLSYSGTATTSFSGLGHLEGETVSVYADGVVLSNETVSGGAVTIDSNGSNVIIGLPYTAKLETMPFVVNAREGLSVGKVSAISLGLINFYKSLGGQYGPDSSNLTDFPYTENYEDTNSLYTGWESVDFLSPEERDTVMYFEQNEPVPFCIRGINVKLTVEER